MPHTPRLIVIDDTPDHFYFLAQVPSHSLKLHMRKKGLLVEVLAVVRELLVVAGQLREKYGAFEVRENMVGVLRSEELLLWINEQYQVN
jgi:hypothetical protein